MGAPTPASCSLPLLADFGSRRSATTRASPWRKGPAPASQPCPPPRGYRSSPPSRSPSLLPPPPASATRFRRSEEGATAGGGAVGSRSPELPLILPESVGYSAATPMDLLHSGS